MAGLPRNKIINPKEPGIFHCWSRCVRRAFLCGKDRYSRKDYEYRRNWIEERLEHLARWFAIDIAFFAILQNHFHLVLRTLPQLVVKWSNKQVVKRSCQIFPTKFKEMGVKDGVPTGEQVRKFAANRKLVNELRSRLSDPSWFLRQLKQNIAARANAEEGKSGHFFEGRFRCKAVTDEMGILICGVYVDLNQIRAGEAGSVKESRRTSAYRRLQGLLARRQKKRGAAAWDGFLCPLQARGDGQAAGYAKAGTRDGQRASDRGLLEMSLEDYLQVLDWVGRQTRRDKRGRIAAQAPPILDQVGLDGEKLLTFVEDFEDLFRHAVGRPAAVQEFTDNLRSAAVKRQG